MAADSQVMVSVSGVRGIVGAGLTPELALAYASALAVYANGGRIVVSRDSRPSGQMLRHAVVAGLTASGCEVIDLGVAPTPTCGRAVRFHEAVGGIQITASHNPSPWNGLKLFGADGAVLPGEEGKRIQAIFDSGNFRRVAWDRLGNSSEDFAGATDHIHSICKMVDFLAVCNRGFHVLLDANRGAGGHMGERFLKEFGCTVTTIGGAADGQFEHQPEPIPENLTTIGPQVVEANAAIGFVLDPDADRLAIFDETGRFIGEELTLALAVKFRLEQQPGTVVANMSTSRVIDDIAHSYGVQCVRTAVGEANVVAGMRANKAVIGGEGNGGVIDPRVGWVRDPFIGMAMILNLMVQTGKTVSELVAELPRYEIVKAKYSVDQTLLDAIFERMEKEWPDAKVNRLDGLRLDWPDRWLHVRPSNTEPIVRAIAEAPTRDAAQRLCEEARALIESLSSQ